ncbi:ABC transporter ATP-binding protein [Aneurinibacillus danicus]|jgi:sulfonate transport system ATP-binding protein|uniref:Sulfonate ABC transporter ATP-binding protein n=1 Tax=Aneurinibacillus danicus TaxID=267746 RepID=A0A511VCZ2_9BACL|nr:ABC transporter ATP-binding protein [Aneurinibacillus danicus]GEN36734.1 sulfonate ABC transporter ATP-binding protein [Aneurinibacillus danicus]
MTYAVDASGFLDIEQVYKSFVLDTGTVDVLHNINVRVKPGEFICIVGASGCGKSTLLRIIAGLDREYEGRVSMKNEPVRGPGVDRGMVFQESRLYPWLTVEKNIAFGVQEGVSVRDRERLVEEHMELVGLSEFSKAYPHQLSGGMQQRASIARALVNKPEVLLLDEPFGALDAITKIHMQQEVLRIWEKEKTTMILVTHDIDEAIYLADRVVVMSSRPGTIKKIVPINLPRPRDRSSYDFMQIRKSIYHEFFTQQDQPFVYSI